MGTLGITGRIAVWSSHHRRAVVLAWVVLLAASLGGGLASGGGFTTGVEITNDPDSARAADLARGYRGSDPLYEQIVVRSSQHRATDPAFRDLVTALVADLRRHPDAIDAQRTFSYLDVPEQPLVSKDGHTALAGTQLTGDLDTSSERLKVLHDVLAKYDGRDGFEVINGGFASVNEAFTETSEKDLSTEFKVMPIALVVLVLVFGAVVAALLPLVIGFVAIGVTIGIVMVISSISPLSFFVTNVVTGIGLAVGIDYALFIIARYREQRRLGHGRDQAIGVAGDTAGRAVLFSGLTVVIALGALLLVPTSIFQSFGIGATLVVLSTVAASMTLLPALVSMLGDRIERFHLPFLRRGGDALEGSGFWARAAHTVMTRAWLMALLSAAFLVALALPYFSIELGAAGAEAIPERYAARRAFDVLNREFSAGLLAPTEIVVSAPDVNAPPVRQALDRLQATLASDASIRQTAPLEVSPRGDVALVTVAVPGEVSGEQAVGEVRRLRREIVAPAFEGSGANAYVGGQTAINADFFDVVDTYTPRVFAFVLGLSFILLLLIFRSIVVPLKSIVMNLLSVGAAYGVITAIFQHGWGSSFLPFEQVDSIEAWLPLFMFTILFGLSMDYHIFLLSRIRERYDQTHNNEESVAFGVRSTANIITGAAAIMVVVFGGFALGELVSFQQMGIGLSVAILLDATIVRTVLVPATMRLLGSANWYMPAWLRWLPDLRVDGDAHPPQLDGTPAGGSGGA